VDGAAPVAVGVKVTVKLQELLFTRLAQLVPPATVKGPVEAGMVAETVLPEKLYKYTVFGAEVTCKPSPPKASVETLR
jgi:hypothetical protein